MIRRALHTGPKVTHQVFNQSSPLVNYNVFKSDPSLQLALKHWGGQDFEKHRDLVDSQGKYCGHQETLLQAETADKNKPVLHQFDKYGRHIDVVEYNPAYHSLMSHALKMGVSAHGYNSQLTGSQVVRAALGYMENQTEAGHSCPLTMTFSAIPALRGIPGYEEWVQKIKCQDYDPRDVPMSDKTAVTIGMSMTEKQGGSDVRMNSTLAKPLHDSQVGNGKEYLLTGHKWFTSAPMCDAFLTLAKVSEEAPPSCFLIPRWKPDGTRNSGFKIMRLKNKLGDHSNGSSEVEYNEAWGTMIGEPGKGVKTIIEMVQSTRLDCILGSSGTARRALHLAINHTRGRSCFGHKLHEQPLMQNLLADMCVEAEAHTLTALRMAKAYDEDKAGRASDDESAFFRMGVAVGKYWVTKRLPNFTFEAMEVFGGNGYTEDFPMSRIYRSAPLNSIWEGSGNVMCLDILRAAPTCLPSLMKEINKARGCDTILDNFLDEAQGFITKIMKNSGTSGGIYPDVQRSAREIAERLAVGMQASILVRFGDPKTAEVYVSTRIRNGSCRLSLGAQTIDASVAHRIIESNVPRI